MLSCIADKLIAKTHKNGKHKQTYKGVNPSCFNKYFKNKACKNTKQNHKEHKACTASGVESGVMLCIFGSKLLARLEAGNRLMLCTVVHKGAFYVWHK